MSSQVPIFFDQAERIDAQIDELIASAMDATKPVAPAPSYEQCQLLRILRFHKGSHKAISNEDLARQIDVTPRQIKDLVRSLVVDYGVKVGSSKNAIEGGYYLIMTDEEAAAASAVFENEIRAMARRLYVLRGKQFTRELLGQLRLEAEGE